MSEKIAVGILDEGIARSGLVQDFTGAGVTVTSAAGKQTISIPGGGGGGGPTLVRKTADQTINGTAFQDITDLSFAIVANTTYYFIFFITFQSTTTTTGHGWSVNGPAVSLLNYRVNYQTIANATAGAMPHRKDVAYDAMAALTSTITLNVNLLVQIEGVIRPSANGTLAARVRSELANNNLTVRADSIGILHTFT